MENKKINKTEESYPLLLQGIPAKIAEQEQCFLYFQFDDDEPILGMSRAANSYSICLSTIDGKLEFTDGKKKFRIFVKSNK